MTCDSDPGCTHELSLFVTTLEDFVKTAHERGWNDGARKGTQGTRVQWFCPYHAREAEKKANRLVTDDQGEMMLLKARHGDYIRVPFNEANIIQQQIREVLIDNQVVALLPYGPDDD